MTSAPRLPVGPSALCYGNEVSLSYGSSGRRLDFINVTDAAQTLGLMMSPPDITRQEVIIYMTE